jgi:hypothetical protein
VCLVVLLNEFDAWMNILQEIPAPGLGQERLEIGMLDEVLDARGRNDECRKSDRRIDFWQVSPLFQEDFWIHISGFMFLQTWMRVNSMTVNHVDGYVGSDCSCRGSDISGRGVLQIV